MLLDLSWLHGPGNGKLRRNETLCIMSGSPNSRFQLQRPVLLEAPL
jgi:hypothetical protein